MLILTSKLEDLKTSYDLISKHAGSLQKSLTALENYSSGSKDDLPSKVKNVTEKATLFRISSNTMINVSIYFFWSFIRMFLKQFMEKMREITKLIIFLNNHQYFTKKFQLEQYEYSPIFMLTLVSFCTIAFYFADIHVLF